MDRIELLTEFILQSDRIERISDSRQLLEDQLRSGKSDGHVGAILYMEQLAKNESHMLSEADVRMVQGLITAEQELKDPNLRIHSRYIGNYRDYPLEMYGQKRADPENIPIYMMSLIDRISRLQRNFKKMTELSVIGEIAGIYFDFEMLHPFADGNGRTGRVIVFYLMKYVGREPFIFTEEEMYLHHFSSLRSGQREVMQKYFWDKSGLF